MKKHFLIKITAVFLSVLMIFSLCACDLNTPQASSYPKNGERKIISTTRDIYLPSGQSKQFEVAHYENQEEILLIEINYAVNEFLIDFLLARSNNTATVEEDDTTFTIVRDNKSFCELDFVKDTVSFDDFDYFSSASYKANPHDLLSTSYINEDGQSEYLERGLSFFAPGYAIEIDLAERNIPLDIYQGKKYIPVQTFNDLFICPYGFNVAYNGESLFVLIGNTIPSELSSLYYNKDKTLRSTALTEFNYNELCLFLDLYYGLQYEHGFTDGFDYYLESIGLKEEFLKPDATNSYNALGTLTFGYIADLHSSIANASPYVGAPAPAESDIKVNSYIVNHIAENAEYTSARDEQLAEVVPYQKVGNTAFVTFDNFTFERSGNYQDDLEQPIGDTIGIISAVHQAITADEEIENVVLDLSCNGGGAIDSAIYTIAWMLGSCDFSIYDSATGSKGSVCYKADVNFDHVFDDNDTIKDKNLYCLVSPLSFSCGNLVPAILKASNKVTIVGKTSSGGGCVVRPGITADGTAFTISDSKQMTIVKNGTYYGIDQGVEPDITLTKIESFYDRAGLAEYLNGLK